MANKDEQEETVFELDISELREQLGIVALEKENEELRKLLAETVTYMNLIDLTVQEFAGEPTVTERIAYNIPKGGRMEAQRQRPPIPSNLSVQKFSLVHKQDEQEK